jgi:hypothetical protein
MTDYSTLKVHPDTLDRLRDAKRRGESYDLLINRLMDAEGVPDATTAEADD